MHLADLDGDLTGEGEREGALSGDREADSRRYCLAREGKGDKASGELGRDGSSTCTSLVHVNRVKRPAHQTLELWDVEDVSNLVP